MIWLHRIWTYLTTPTPTDYWLACEHCGEASMTKGHEPYCSETCETAAAYLELIEHE